eukprot:GCRY01000512.1.p1 GENE.GCRY01000512.1~~GCRY01000512.1.p1  ORF type:complete len:2633 (-),score=648.95 GCRY01000512.1:503-8401(-)
MNWQFAFVAICLYGISLAFPPPKDPEPSYDFGGVVFDKYANPSFCNYSSSESASKRSLETTTIVNPTFIPGFKGQLEYGETLYEKRIYSFLHFAQFVFGKLSPTSSEFLLYPYNFNRTNPENETEIVNFEQGSLIDLNLDDIPEDYAHWFGHLTQNLTLTPDSALSIYGGNIAILRLYHEAENEDDLSYEYTSDSSSFMNPFVYFGGMSVYYSSTDFDAATASGTSSLSVVYLNETEIQSGYLDISRFSMFILPDIYDGEEQVIVDLLGSLGAQRIRAFANSGGTVLASSDGVYVAEQLGLFATGTVSTEKRVVSRWSEILTEGCSFEDATEGDGFAINESVERILCFGTDEDNHGWYFGEAPLIDTSKVDVISHANSDMYYKDTTTNIIDRSSPIPDPKNIPVLFHRAYGQGHVVGVAGFPAYRSPTFQYMYNTYFLANSLPLALDYKLQGNFSVIPAYEEIQLTVNFTCANYYQEDLAVDSFIFYIAKGVDVVISDSDCSSITPTESAVPGDSYRTDVAYSCSLSTLPAHTTFRTIIEIRIVDVAVTASGKGVPLLQPKVIYQRPSSSRAFTASRPVTVDAAMAALIRCDQNPDPIAHYPVMGRGQTIDDVVWAENKEETIASEVEFVAIIPLIAPITDGFDQAEIITPISFDHMYYHKVDNGAYDYKYPFDTIGNLKERDFDVLDWRLLGKRSDLLVADWDTPVRVFKKTRAEITEDYAPFFPITFPDLPRVEPSDIFQAGYQTTVPDTDEIILKQAFFSDADSFFEHATQRMIPFLDTETAEGFAVYDDPRSWPASTGHVCPALKMHPDGRRMKQELLFGRVDIYYYNTREELPLPNGVDTADTIFTIDRYADPYVNGTYSCDSDVSYPVHYLVDGYYDHTITSYPPGLKPREYNNMLLTFCSRQKAMIHADVLGTPEDPTDGKVKMTHYIYRLGSNPMVTSGEHAMFFEPENSPVDGSQEWYYAPALHETRMGVEENPGRFGDYPELRLLYIWGGDFILPAAESRHGGRVVLHLPAGVSYPADRDPVALTAITWSADSVAVVETVYDRATNTIYMYFKRGNMPNESNGLDSSMLVNLQWLEVTDPTIISDGDFTVSGELESMFYDLSAGDADHPYESYEPTSYTLSFKITKQLAVQLPALELRHRLPRGENNAESYMQPFEYMEPFLRTGTYMQELKARRDIYGSAEAHHINSPGLQSQNRGFMWPNCIGVESVPFSEYLSTGDLYIPSAATTSRFEWRDIWDRRWAQPVRSVFVDVPPIPPPVRNFMMTTTFEMRDVNTGRRLMEWPSDQEVLVHVEMKFLNNYPKYFEITNCEDNAVWQYGSGRPRVFPTDEVREVPDTETAFDKLINSGHSAQYGDCFSEPMVILEGREVQSEELELIPKLKYCVENETWYDGCTGAEDLPTISRRTAIDSAKGVFEEGLMYNNVDYWNYANRVEEHYPENYIKENMWDMTHYDYDDNDFDKAYKYHMDDRLPNIDNGIIKPHNIIAYPIYKGLGYSMNYDKDLSHWSIRHGQYKGWWSDQLQNKDHTLIAGQRYSPDIAVGGEDLVANGLGWIEIDDLSTEDEVAPTGAAKWAKRNMYTCLFNRRRVQVNPDAKLQTYPVNVYENNVVPVDHTLTTGDPRLTNYVCGDTFYRPENISSFPMNYLETNSPRDWLYFATSLRGNSKENLHVLYNLVPNEGAREGVTKVQDGGRFVYWNPCCGPNAYLIIDAPVSTVIAKRSDIEIEMEILPEITLSVQGPAFLIIDIFDEPEIERRYTSNVYANYHGFGDFAVQMYVGAYDSSCWMEPGSTTYAKIEFYNNAGFDMRMKASAIDFEEKETKFLNGNDLLYNMMHTVKAPLSFNFMPVTGDEELMQYLEIRPSVHNIDTASLFFDFENINVVNLRDGYKGTFFYEIVMKDGLPDKFRGRLHHLKVNFNSTYFDRVPGEASDPTHVDYHDYTITIPDIVIAIPYASDHPTYPGQAFFTSGYATDLSFRHYVSRYFNVSGVKVVSKNDTDELRVIVGDRDGDRFNQLDEYWKNLNRTNIPFRHYDSGIVNYDLTPLGDTFPFKVDPLVGPDQAELKLLVKLETLDCPVNDLRVASYYNYLTYKDEYGFTKRFRYEDDLKISVRGALLSVTYEGHRLNETLDVLEDQTLYPDDSGIISLLINVQNVGDDTAFHVNTSVLLSQDVRLMENLMTLDYEIIADTDENNAPVTGVLVQLGQDLNPGSQTSFQLFLEFDPMEAMPEPLIMNQRSVLAVSERVFAKGVKGIMDLTQVHEERRVTQVVPDDYSLPIVSADRPTAVLNGSKDVGAAKVQAHLQFELLNYTGNYPVTVVFNRSNLNFEVHDSDPEYYTITTIIVGDEEGHFNENGNIYIEYSDKVRTADGNNDLEVDYVATVYTAQGVFVSRSNVWEFRQSPQWWIWFLVGAAVVGGLIAAFLLFFYRSRRFVPYEEKVVQEEEPEIEMETKERPALPKLKKSAAREALEREEEDLQDYQANAPAPKDQHMRLGNYYRSGMAPPKLDWGKAGATKSAPKTVAGEKDPNVTSGEDSDIVDMSGANANSRTDRSRGKRRPLPPNAGRDTWWRRFIARCRELFCCCLVRPATNRPARTQNSLPPPQQYNGATRSSASTAPRRTAPPPPSRV